MLNRTFFRLDTLVLPPTIPHGHPNPIPAYPHQRPRQRNLPLSPPTRTQPRRLASLVRRSIRPGATTQCPRLPLHRILNLLLVSCHGTRILRKRRHRQDHERALRLHQSRSRRTPRHRRHLYGRNHHLLRLRRLAHVRLPRTKLTQTFLRRNLLPPRTRLRPPVLPPTPRRTLGRLENTTRQSHRTSRISVICSDPTSRLRQPTTRPRRTTPTLQRHFHTPPTLRQNQRRILHFPKVPPTHLP